MIQINNLKRPEDQEAFCHKTPRIFYDISCAISPAFSPTFSLAFLPHFLPQFLPHFPRSSPAFLPHFLQHFSRFVLMGVKVCQFWMWNYCLVVVGWVRKLLPTRVFHFGQNRRVAQWCTSRQQIKLENHENCLFWVKIGHFWPQNRLKHTKNLICPKKPDCAVIEQVICDTLDIGRRCGPRGKEWQNSFRESKMLILIIFGKFRYFTMLFRSFRNRK